MDDTPGLFEISLSLINSITQLAFNKLNRRQYLDEMILVLSIIFREYHFFYDPNVCLANLKISKIQMSTVTALFSNTNSCRVLMKKP